MFYSLDRHSEKTVTLSELLSNIYKFDFKIVYLLKMFHEHNFKIARVITIHVSHHPISPLNALQWRHSISSWRLKDIIICRHLSVELTFYILFTQISIWSLNVRFSSRATPRNLTVKTFVRIESPIVIIWHAFFRFEFVIYEVLPT